MNERTNEILSDLFSEKLLIIAGHYGTGKTNVAVSMSVYMAKAGHKTSIVDLDIVNPYFRMADNAGYVKQFGVRPIVPEYANTNVDMPTLPYEFYSVFDSDGKAVLDVGGDDDGAVVLATHKEKIEKSGYKMVFVYNKYRLSISDPADALQMMRDIEASSDLKFCGIINNSNLGAETTPEIIEDSVKYADELSRLSGLPVLCTTVLKRITVGIPGVIYIEDATKKLF